MRLRALPAAFGAAIIGSMVLVLAGCATTTAQLAHFNAIVVSEPDLSAVADGSYTGAYRVKPAKGKFVAQPYVEVLVEVADRRYRAVKVIAPAELRGNQHLASLGSELLAGQSLTALDAVSASTMTLSYTGKAYLKAIETAVSP